MIAMVEKLKATRPVKLLVDKFEKVSPIVASGMLAVGSMAVNVSADTGDSTGSTGSFDTVLSYAGKALDFCTSNPTMSTIFYCSMAGAVFYVIKFARRAVR